MSKEAKGKVIKKWTQSVTMIKSAEKKIFGIEVEINCPFI